MLLIKHTTFYNVLYYIFQKLKFNMTNLTRKCGSTEMFTDIYNRIYMDSSPVVRRFRKKPVTISKINPPQLSPDDDILVKSFFANEDTLPYFG